MLPRIFYYLITVKKLQMTVPLMYNFRSLSNFFPMIQVDDFLKCNSLHFTAQVRLFFVQKGNLKFSNSKM